MTSDDILSMIKACDQVLSNMDLLNNPTNGVPSMVDAQLDGLRKNVVYLATIQRDILKGILG